MDIIRVTARWSGFLGAPGYSNFYFGTAALDGGLFGDVAQDAAENVSVAFGQIEGLLPDGVRVDIEQEAAIIDSDTGEVQSFEALDDIDPAFGSASGGYAGPVGAVINWRTNDVRFGRRIRGRTFLVPLASSAYESNGTLTPLALQNLGWFGRDLRGNSVGAELGVWSRPRDGSGGVFATVTSHNVPDMAAVLRSRRD